MRVLPASLVCVWGGCPYYVRVYVRLTACICVLIVCVCVCTTCLSHPAVHTMDELRLTGNCLKGSRPLLSFDGGFDTEPHLALLRELFSQTFNVPRGHPKSQPFFDHVLSFSVLDGKIWVRHYQVRVREYVLARSCAVGLVCRVVCVRACVSVCVDVSMCVCVCACGKLIHVCVPSPSLVLQIVDAAIDAKGIKKVLAAGEDPVTLVEIGPRFVLDIVRMFQGSFGGPTLYQNASFVSPNEVCVHSLRFICLCVDCERAWDVCRRLVNCVDCVGTYAAFVLLCLCSCVRGHVCVTVYVCGGAGAASGGQGAGQQVRGPHHIRV